MKISNIDFTEIRAVGAALVM